MIVAHVLVCVLYYTANTWSKLDDHSDVGECLIGTHNCSQICLELDGGYKCGCYKGYRLADDGVTCKGIIK